MTLIDSHCHLDFEQFNRDRPATLQRARQAGVAAMVNPGVDLESRRAALALAAAHDAVWAAVGIHPNSSANFRPAWIEELRRLAEGERVVAIGEIGLDYYRERAPKSVQKQALWAQLELARELNLPVILHCRQSAGDVLAMLARWRETLPAARRERAGVWHAFAGSLAEAEQALALGLYLGLGGPLTFRQAEALRAVVRAMPAD